MNPYYADGAVTIYHGVWQEVLPALPPKSVHAITADPPFSIPVKYEDADGNYPRSWGDLMVMAPYFDELFRALKRVSKDDSQVNVCCDAQSYPVFYRCAYELWTQSQMVVWYKPTGRRGRGWQHAHELVLHLRNPQTTYTEGFRQDVIGIMPVRTLNRQHPAEKPGDLWGFLGEGFPDGYATLLDPFAGSGSSLRWAKDHGLKAIGVEQNEAYCEVAARKCSQDLLDFAGSTP